MATEYPLREGESQQELARDLLDQTDDPSVVSWSPRPDVPGGGVYVVSDDRVAEAANARRAARQAEQERIEAAQQAADKRDSDPAVAEGLLTPSEAGFAANAGTDPGSKGEAQRIAETVQGDQDAARTDAEDLSEVPDQESRTDEEAQADAAADADDAPAKLTPAQKRAAAKKAAADKATTENTESE